MSRITLLAGAIALGAGVVMLGEPDFELLGAFICFSVGIAAWLSL